MAFISGDNWVYCDMCSFKVRKSQTSKDYKGRIVCNKCLDPRPPQESPIRRRDNVFVRDARPEPTDVFRDPRDVTADDL